MEELQQRVQILEAQLASYHDQTVSMWAQAALIKALSKEIIKGDENGNINPKQPVTREQLMFILDRLGLLGP